MSALSQDYDNLEVIVSDDASPDSTAQVLKKLEAAHSPRLRVHVNQQNLGISGNSNQALGMCNGYYICMMGGDDILFPEKIHEQVALMESDPGCNICYHDAEIYDSVSGQVLDRFSNAYGSYEGDMAALVSHGTFNCALTNMFRRSAIPPHGFTEKIRYASDWLFWIELLARGGSIRYIDKVMGRYVKHGGNITESNSLQMYLDHLKTTLIILYRYPQQWKSVLTRYREVLVQMVRQAVG